MQTVMDDNKLMKLATAALDTAYLYLESAGIWADVASDCKAYLDAINKVCPECNHTLMEWQVSRVTAYKMAKTTARPIRALLAAAKSCVLQTIMDMAKDIR